jgi:hypothetical protein
VEEIKILPKTTHKKPEIDLAASNFPSSIPFRIDPSSFKISLVTRYDGVVVHEEDKRVWTHKRV